MSNVGKNAFAYFVVVQFIIQPIAQDFIIIHFVDRQTERNYRFCNA
jgi:hypothetical protein